MAGEAIKGLSGLPELLMGLAMAAGELDQEMGKNALKTLKKYADVIPVFKAEFGDNFNADMAMSILELLIPKSMRVAFAEVLVRGDVSLRQNIEVEAGLKVGFAPYVSLNAAGAYHRTTSEAWGSEVRVTLAALTPDSNLLSEFVKRAQERPSEKADILSHLDDIYPIITAIFGDEPMNTE